MTTDPLAAILADDNETEGATARRVEREHYAMTYIKGLHNLADFLSNHRDAIPDKFSGAVTVTLTGWTPEELATHIKALGGGEKFANDYRIGVADN